MKTKTIIKACFMIMAFFSFLLQGSTIEGKETLRYASSAQVMAALGEGVLKQFEEDSGVKVDLFVGSSDVAVHRMMHGVADIASSAERIAYSSTDSGYTEILFAKAPIIVITNVSTPVKDLTIRQLKEIFNGSVNNWKEVGGPDKEIIVVIPDRNTAAFKNFTMLALKRYEVKFDYLAHQSTDVVNLVKHMPWSISFITKGEHTSGEPVKTIAIDGRKPEDKDYPFLQEFYFVTKGEPEGSAKKLIDFFFTEKAKSAFKKSGLMPAW
jgi:phosphate transport system substrate-binding protein